MQTTKLSTMRWVLCLGLLAGGCTAGNIVDANGNNWTPSTTAYVSFVRKSTGDTYTVQTGTRQGYTSFSFDPYAPASSTNNPVQLPDDDYTIVVRSGTATWLTEGYTVHVNVAQACPWADGNTGKTGIDCVLFTLKLYPCGTSLFDGPSGGVVPLTHMGCAWPQTVSSCPGGAPAAQHVAIDCSTLTDPISSANCRPYARDVACRVAPEYVELTGVTLQTPCPTMSYAILQSSAWMPGVPDAGGLYAGGTCNIWVRETSSVNPAARYNQWSLDPHQILHAFQYWLAAKLLELNHPFFGTSMLELRRQLGLVTDAGALGEAQSNLNNALAIPTCTGAEESVAWTMYIAWLQNGAPAPDVVSSLYSNLTLLNVAQPTWSSALLYHHALINTSSDPNAAQILLAKGCAL